METDVAVSKGDLIDVRPFEMNGESRLERRARLRAALLSVLREEGHLTSEDSYFKTETSTEGGRTCCTIKVADTGLAFRAEAPCGDDNNLMETYMV
jgi:hypothetical protein